MFFTRAASPTRTYGHHLANLYYPFFFSISFSPRNTQANNHPSITTHSITICYNPQSNHGPLIKGRILSTEEIRHLSAGLGSLSDLVNALAKNGMTDVKGVEIGGAKVTQEGEQGV